MGTVWLQLEDKVNYKPLNRNIYSSNLKVLGLLYISPHRSCGKIRGQTKSVIRGRIPVFLTGKPEFGAPNCLVRALKYYHRYMSEHPELRKGRRRLVIPFKDNNVGKQLSAAYSKVH